VHAASAVSPSDVEGPFTWGSAEKVTHLRHLWLADQPDEVGLVLANDAGVAVVINLRSPSESDWDEASAAGDLGLSYYNVPITGKRFEPDAIARIDALVEEHDEQQILIHCSSSNRAGGWLATHLVSERGMSVDDALAVGRRTGITKDGIVTRVRDYVEAVSTPRK
jgi:protein tyrosine phosphatase (PTP) superfamily phosphohydrolase (DUF442 family)